MELKLKTKRLIKRVYYQLPVQRAAIKLLAPWKRRPFTTSTMEFDYGLWLGISSLHCEDGRQLGEDNTWPYFFRERIPTEYHTSNMPGSRAGHAINITTLHLVMKRWDTVLPLVASLRAHFGDVMPTDGAKLALGDLYVLSKAGVALPSLMARRREVPVRDGELPADVATQFKIIAGVFMVIQKMLWSGRYSVEDQLDSAAFYDYADKHGIFISPSGYACGGSRRKILELYNVIHKREEVPADKSPLGKYADPGQLFDYALNATALDLLLLGSQRELQRFYYSRLKDFDDDNSRDRSLRHIEKQLDIETDSTSPDFRCQGIWPLFDRLASARIDHAAQTDSAAAINQLGLDAQLTSTNEIIAHYRSCLRSLADASDKRQRCISEVLGTKASSTITPQRMAKRLNVLPTSILGRLD